MFSRLTATWIGSLVLFIAFPVSGQAPAPKPSAAQPAPPGSPKLTDEDEKRAKQLDEETSKAIKADRWDVAIAKAELLLALRARVQGPKHFETVDAEWLLKALRRVAAMPREDRVAYPAAWTINEQAIALDAQVKYAQAQPLFEKALEIRRRLLTDDHPDTATDYDNLAANLLHQGKYAQAQPLFEKGLEIRRHLLTDNHPDTAGIYNNLATNLGAQGKHAQAQPLFEKALEIFRRLLTANHPHTASWWSPRPRTSTSPSARRGSKTCSASASWRASPWVSSRPI